MNFEDQAILEGIYEYHKGQLTKETLHSYISSPECEKDPFVLCMRTVHRVTMERVKYAINRIREDNTTKYDALTLYALMDMLGLREKI